MDGFKREARTVLSGKLSRDEAEEMLEKKYDTETAQVIENSITECAMQVAEFEGDINEVRKQLVALQVSVQQLSQ